MAWSFHRKLQFGGLFLSLLGCVCSCVAIFLRDWKTLNTPLNQRDTWTMGLWNACIIRDVVGMVCEPFSNLTLPRELRIARVLMMVSQGFALLGLVLSACGSGYCQCHRIVKVLKGRLCLLGGILEAFASATTLFPVSWVAHVIVQEFWDNRTPEVVPRWDFGGALYLGWGAGLCLAAGGLLLIFSTCLGKENVPSLMVDSTAQPSWTSAKALDDSSQTMGKPGSLGLASTKESLQLKEFQ